MQALYAQPLPFVSLGMYLLYMRNTQCVALTAKLQGRRVGARLKSERAGRWTPGMRRASGATPSRLALAKRQGY